MKKVILLSILCLTAMSCQSNKTYPSDVFQAAMINGKFTDNNEAKIIFNPVANVIFVGCTEYKDSGYTFITFEIRDLTIDSACTEYWSMDIYQNDELVKIVDGKKGNVPDFTEDYWYNFMTTDVTDIVVNGPFTVVVKSYFEKNKNWSFYVTGSETATRQIIKIDIDDKEEVMF